MRLIRVGAATLNQTPLDWDGNAVNILAAIKAARERDVSLLCLPELCVSGYGCEDAFFSGAVRKMAWRVLEEILPETGATAVSLGLPVMFQGAVFNTAVLVVDRRIVGLVPKQHLAGDGLHYEPRWFKPWPVGVATTLHQGGGRYPIGDLLFDLAGIRLGFEICEDAWVARRPGGEHARFGVDIILNPSASHFAFGKAQTRQHLVLEGSRAFGVTYVYSNLVGNEAGRVIYDGGAMIASAGRLVAQGERLSFLPWGLTDAVVDVDATRMRRAQSASHSPEIKDPNERLVDVDFQLRPCPPQSSTPTAAAWEMSDHLPEEEFTRAIALALLDYMRKSHSSGFVVSLSGGADSAAVACLAALMVRLGCQELGLAEFGRRAGLGSADDVERRDLTGRILTTVYQATRNSSDTTRQAADSVAKALEARHVELDVDDMSEAFVAKIEAGLARRLSWETDDIALQNIQARSRGPGAWLIANLQNALLLATSNRSEAAVGYATMDGDTCGGVSPIAGIDKAFLRKWLGWLEVTGPQGLGPIPALGHVNAIEPTAELRPQESGQIDEDDLMPYGVLDAVEDEAIGEKKAPDEVLASLVVRFPAYSPSQLQVWVTRFFQLWSRNQWKRERYAPSFHVDDKNLDPKTWCRFPILSGSFRRELRELGQERA